MAHLQDSIRVVQLASTVGAAETWTRTVNSPNPGDVTFTGSAGSSLIVPSDERQSSGSTLPVANTTLYNTFVLYGQALPADNGLYVKLGTTGAFYWVQLIQQN